MIAVLIRTKDKIVNNQEVQKRKWKNFNPEFFINKIGNIDWGDFYSCENIDILNTICEEKVGGGV